MQVTNESREGWAANPHNAAFAAAVNPHINDEQGFLDIERMYAYGRSKGMTKEWRHLNPGHQRMLWGRAMRRFIDA